ncbi:unnamed protein product [Plutella xylostella]|uniref:(diamondback moth) hypothetical protein n=1 Tax=Plutella xylostella TaxID=51655 RepID=A0A8S4DL23_PLUXY|nr:unnamed protein product [Plutella xylostella]
MTVGNVLSQMGIGTKHAADRYSDYHGGGASHEPHVVYSYDPHAHSHVSSKHSYHSYGKKNHAAMSALTLLAFLFFLHILQQCLREHMQSMSTPQVMIMTAGREGEQKLSKINTKMDKSGVTEIDTTTQRAKERIKNKSHRQRDDERKREENGGKSTLTKIKTAQHTPIMNPQSYKHLYQDYSSRGHSFHEISSPVNVD